MVRGFGLLGVRIGSAKDRVVRQVRVESRLEFVSELPSRDSAHQLAASHGDSRVTGSAPATPFFKRVNRGHVSNCAPSVFGPRQSLRWNSSARVTLIHPRESPRGTDSQGMTASASGHQQKGIQPGDSSKLADQRLTRNCRRSVWGQEVPGLKSRQPDSKTQVRAVTCEAAPDVADLPPRFTARR